MAISVKLLPALDAMADIMVKIREKLILPATTVNKKCPGNATGLPTKIL